MKREGSVVYSLDRETRFSNHLRCASRGQEANIVLDKALGQVKQSGLVIDGDDGCWYLAREVWSFVSDIPVFWVADIL